MTEWGKRVAARRTQLGMSQKELAMLCRVKPPSVNDWERGKTKSLKADSLLALAKALHCTAEYITTGSPNPGEYPGPNLSKMPPGAQEPTPSQFADKGSLAIPQLDIRASMGLGVDAPDHVDVVRVIQVNLPELKRVLPSFTKPQNLAILTGYGDSMQPTFQDGDPLVIDTGVKEVTVDGVYVMERDGPAGWELFVKRLQRQLDGSLLMISDNPKYRPQHITDADRSRFKVAGRALGVWNFTKL